MSSGEGGACRLVAMDAATMKPTASVAMLDPKSGGNAPILNEGTASPMIGPDGDVYMGVFDAANTSRGWMEHYSADLSQTKPAGGFGWDDTASIVPASMVPSYHGNSTYLIMTKYNNYAGGSGGDGHNMIAILDPNATETDTRANNRGLGASDHGAGGGVVSLADCGMRIFRAIPGRCGNGASIRRWSIRQRIRFW